MAAVGGLEALARAMAVPAVVPRAAIALWCGVLGLATWRQAPVWHDSESLWQYGIARNPDCLPCEQNLGSVRLAQGRLEEAEGLLDRARRRNPRDRKIVYSLGVIRERQGRLEEASAYYREAVKLDPTWPDAHNNLGVMLLHDGRTEEARQQFEETLRFHPGDVEAELNLGLVAADADDWDEAERRDRRAVASATDDEQSVDAHRELAKVLVKRGKVGEAIGHYQAALALAPDDADALAALAWIRATSADERWRDGTEAIRLAERLSAASENRDADALDTLAAAYAEAGRFDDAVRSARTALAADPSSELAKEITERLALYEARRPYRAP
jgi:protein O-mannosyl-transferase